MKTAMRILILLLALFTPAALLAEEDERPIKMSEAPAPVKKAIKTFLGLLPNGSEVEELCVEEEDGATVYEVEIETPGGAEYELELSAKGKILEIEMEDDDEDDDDD